MRPGKPKDCARWEKVPASGLALSCKDLMETTNSHTLLVAEDDQHLSAPRPSCLLICVNILSCLLMCVNILSCLLPTADNLFAGQTAVGKISSCLTLNSISQLVNVTKDMMAWKAYTDYDSIGKWSCLEWTLSMTASNLVLKKCGNQSAFCELHVSQSEEGSRLGDDLGCASSGWWARARRWQLASDETSSAQFHNC